MDKDLLHDAVQLAASHIISNSIMIGKGSKQLIGVDGLSDLVEKYYKNLKDLSSK